MRCPYCFKGKKRARSMTLETAKAAMDWLLEASGGSPSISIVFFGGEPLLEFDLLRETVEYASLRGSQQGKRVFFSITSNLSLVSDEVVGFFRKWGIGFHASIDGIPEIQDTYRKFRDGQPSSRIVEENARKVLSYWPNCHARCTYGPDTVGYLARDLEYFAGIGFMRFAFTPAVGDHWSAEALSVFEDQFRQLGDIYIRNLRRGRRLEIAALEYGVAVVDRKDPTPWHCGAGVGMLAVDVEGFLWPCHRMNGLGRDEQWILGSVFGGFENAKRDVFLDLVPSLDRSGDCEQCDTGTFCSIPCIAENWELSRDIYKPHPSICAIFRIMAAETRRIRKRLELSDNAALGAILSDWGPRVGLAGGRSGPIEGGLDAVPRRGSMTCFI